MLDAMGQCECYTGACPNRKPHPVMVLLDEPVNTRPISAPAVARSDFGGQRVDWMQALVADGGDDGDDAHDDT